ncbi:MAG: hypothetical protein ACI4E3_02640 [Candidatus Fimousia sp.]
MGVKNVIKLSNLEEKIILEDSIEFEESAFSFVYQKAGVLLRNIIDQNRKYVNSANENIDKFGKPVDNIISFEGRRGTGKTSTMLSVRNALRNYQRNRFLEVKDKPGEYEDIRFTVLDYIDASLLEKTEDILGQILANMFSKVLEYDKNNIYKDVNEYERKELYRNFDEAYGTLLKLRQSNSNMVDSSPIRTLAAVSGSIDLGMKIRRLVKNYLSYLSGESQRKKEHFLVITIDDVDMNFGDDSTKIITTPYDILEEIHRYLMIPGVIILMTYNFKDLCIACDKHFEKILGQSKISNHGNGSYIHDLTIQYFEKVIPGFFRVHMSSLQKRDYSHSLVLNRNGVQGIYVKMTEEEIKRIFGSFSLYLLDQMEIEKECSWEINIKKFMFLLRVASGDLFYDGIGSKRHYLETSGLRDVAHAYKFNMQLRDLCCSSKQKDIDAAVYKELLDDLYFRFAIEKLSEDENDILRKYLNLPIERRSQNILEDIKASISKIFDIYENEDFPQIRYRNKYVPSYSYGELTYYLYYASKHGIFSKELIWCVLDSYTIVMTDLYKKSIDCKEPNREEYKKRFCEIIGMSVASSWSNGYIPKLAPNSMPSEFQNFTVETEGKSISIGAVRITNTKCVWIFKLSGDKNKLQEELQRFEILSMFFSYPIKNGKMQNGEGTITFNPKPEDVPVDQAREANWQIEIGDSCFNIMNFVNNLFNGKEFFEDLHYRLEGAWKAYCKSIKQRSALKKLEETSLKKGFEEWNKTYHGMAMPIYSLDIMYNIFKRQLINTRIYEASVNASALWNYICKVYKDIGDYLEQEDKFYFSNLNGDFNQELNDEDNMYRKNRFSKAYKECEFIKYVNKLSENPEEEKAFIKAFEMLAYSL